MRSDEAAAIIDTVMAAWEWEMEPLTLQAWSTAIERLDSAEAAEVAVVELYTSWTRQKGRHPMIGEVVEHYSTVRRRMLAERSAEAVAELPEPQAPAGTPSEILRLVNELRSEGHRGGDLVRAVLLRKGIDTPADTLHAESYDPPLSVAEQRHDLHRFHRAPQPDVCRFCRITKEGPVVEEIA